MSMDVLMDKIREKGNPTVAGLDPNLSFIPKFLVEASMAKYEKPLDAAAKAIWEFNKTLIDNLCDIIPAVKPQSAYYEMYGLPGMLALKRTIEYAKDKGMYVILDVKRGDIGPTAKAYSSAYLGRTNVNGEFVKVFGPDSITVNGYLGSDGITPFIEDVNDYGGSIFVLVKTSNPSSGELQDIVADQRPVYETMADMVSGWGQQSMGKQGYSNIGAVVGATYPQQLKHLRAAMEHTFFLVPGYGAQGGGAEDIAGAFDKNGEGAIVNSSRAIMCAYQTKGKPEEDFGLCARQEAIRMRDEIAKVVYR